MARRKRKPTSNPIIPRTIERIAIAALAAIASRGSEKSIAVVAITIFLCLVFLEELGRRWVWHGKAVTLRDVALGTIGDLRLLRSGIGKRNKRRKRRTRYRSGGSGRAAPARDKARRRLQE